MTYQYSDGNTSCGHHHRSERAARHCPAHLRLIQSWWREGDIDLPYRQYRAESIRRAEIIPEAVRQ